MELIKIYLLALMTFLVMDGIWLGFIAKNLYKNEIGHLMTSSPNWIAAIVFYLLFLVGLIYFVINPAIAKESIKYAIGAGALFGLITYATYDLTNLATLKAWPLKITMIDLSWGTFLSATVSSVTYYLYNIFK